MADDRRNTNRYYPVYDNIEHTVNDKIREDVTVLIVEDERELADIYAAYVPEEYAVAVVYSGEEAIEVLSDEFDIVLLDRRMPVVSGHEVLAHIDEQGLDCRVAMVTAINPDFDIIDLHIDDYLVKPVTREDLLETIDRMVQLQAYDERMRELTSKKLKRNVLKLEKTHVELARTDEFQRLNEEIETIEAELEDIADDLDSVDAESRSRSH